MEQKLVESLEKANAHPYGLNPFKRMDYIEKFLTLTDGIIRIGESKKIFKGCAKFNKN